MDLKGGIAILAEKFKPGTTSDGAILREAYQAGAVAVIKIGGGGAMLYSVPDPTEIPCPSASRANCFPVFHESFSGVFWSSSAELDK